jgi:hypothetical protein
VIGGGIDVRWRLKCSAEQQLSLERNYLFVVVFLSERRNIAGNPNLTGLIPETIGNLTQLVIL